MKCKTVRAITIVVHLCSGQSSMKTIEANTETFDKKNPFKGSVIKKIIMEGRSTSL